MNYPPNKNLLKVAFCAILLTSNIGNSASIIGAILNIIFSYLKSSYIVHLGISVAAYLLSISTTIGVFVYFYKHLEYNFKEKSLNKMLLINLIFYPISYLINTGLTVLNTKILTQTYDVQFIGEYYVPQSIITIVCSVLSTLIFTTLAIILLVKNPVNGNETDTNG